MTISQILQTIDSHASGVVVIFVIASGLIEVSKIKLNPWTDFFNFLKKLLFGEITKSIDGISKDLKMIQEHISENEAKNARARILRFGDELLANQKHSREMFDTVLIDIDYYNNYCDTHKEFKNGKTVMTTQHIENVYKRCMDKNDFL